ncbi:MAG: hypothetical protein KatS3mg115_0125 [Candidatus Poribacteria bacterium]|nr:MAG: hypothetical protein KatS3mg115_0125 [Candidatus Poribacteria bacterium]
MKSRPILFTDEQMRQFLTHGYVILQSTLPAEIHAEIYEQLERVFAEEGNPGNNVLPRVPAIQQVFDDPVVHGAFVSVLGEDYLMHPHRHCHRSPKGRDGGWHKDSYWGYRKVRHHRSRWAMAFYYPQDVPPEIGPTGIYPGTQYHDSRNFSPEESGVNALGSSGLVVIIHYDIWHRATANRLDKTRYMLKFEFARLDEPTAPSWDNQEADWRLPEDLPPYRHEALWESLWTWIRGEQPRFQSGGNGDLKGLAKRLSDESEVARLNAAYELARYGDRAVGPLADALWSEAPLTVRAAAYGLAAIGEPALEALTSALRSGSEETRTHAAFALGEIGPAAAPAAEALAEALQDESTTVRRHAAEALGIVRRPSSRTVPPLIQALDDPDDQTRFNAVLSLARIGAEAHEALPALQAALLDPNRYVRGYAVSALRRIGTPEALQIALDYLETARWCPSTTPRSTF